MNYVWLMLMILSLGSCTKKVETEKVLHLITPAQVKGLDPINANDLYSSNEIGRVYEGLLQIHYLKRPYELTTNLAATMPTISDDQLTYTISLKKGVLFHDDACFPGGVGREMTAEDVIYSLKRVADPKLQSLGWWVFDGVIAGLNQWRETNQKVAAVDYSAPIEGLKVIDPYTVAIKLSKPYPQFLFALAMPFSFIVAKEAVEKYGQEFLNEPVGTGPFMLDKFTQAGKMVYTRNPKYREEFYPSEGSPTDQASGLLADAGKKIPFVDKVEVSVVVENSPAWLSFLKGDVDTATISKENFKAVMNPDLTLKEEFSKKGIVSYKINRLDVTYISFNFSLPLFANNVKLRRAMSMAYDNQKINTLFYNGLSIPAQSILPPDLAGHDPEYKNPWVKYDVEAAKKLLAEAGYPEGKGLPDIEYYTGSSTENRQQAEAFRDMMKAIGITIKVMTVPWTELQNKVTTKQAMMFGMAWGADYPDAENFFGILYGPHKAPGSNGSNFDDPVFNKMFEESYIISDVAVRTEKYKEMYRYAGEQVPWIFGQHRAGYALTQGWMKNIKDTEFTIGISKYYNIDLDKKNELKAKL